MPIPTLIKQPTESRLYTMEFAANLAVGETISAVNTVTAAPNGLTLNGAATFSGTKVFQRIDSGTTDTLYKITIRVTTSAANILEGEGYLRVQDI